MNPSANHPADPHVSAVEPITTRDELMAHPAVNAWRKAGGQGPDPSRIQVIGDHKKSGVFRLYDVIPNGSIIAKRGRQGTLETERLVYGQILPRLSIPNLQFHGHWSEQEESSAWLFLEDAGDDVFCLENTCHRRLAAEWLARLHIQSHLSAALESLPDVGASHYAAHVLRAKELLLACRENPALTSECHCVLQGIIQQCDELREQWGSIAELCATFPRVLVHGDFMDKNLRVREGPLGPTLFVFDWELAGWGPPVTDLETIDLPAYWKLGQGCIPELNPSRLRRMKLLGKIFRNISAINWAAIRLVEAGPWVQRPIGQLQVYLTEGGQMLDQLNLT